MDFNETVNRGSPLGKKPGNPVASDDFIMIKMFKRKSIIIYH